MNATLPNGTLPPLSSIPSAIPIRIALVAPSLRRLLGGQEVQASLLLRYWQGDTAASFSFVPNDPPPPQWLSFAEKLPGIRTATRFPFYLLSLWGTCGQCQIAHIFSSSYTGFLLATLPACLIAHLRGCKTLIHYHDGRAQDHLEHSRLAVFVMRHSDALIVPSPYLADVFGAFGLRAEVVPNVVDVASFPYRKRRTVRPRLICTRNFEQHYGVDLVVRAFVEIKNRFPQAVLRLVGRGPAEPFIRNVVAELSASGVEFIGAVSPEQMGRLYDDADIFVNASWVDNLPGSILEAFTCGLPVVTTSAGGIKYLVEQERNGLTCNTGDWKSLANNVFRLLEEPGLALQLSSRALQDSFRYHWENVRANWLACYSKLASQRKSDN
jgi:glycosyltransferase involved in cell wall biosynthesis